jgi:hypothetical protein
MRTSAGRRSGTAGRNLRRGMTIFAAQPITTVRVVPGSAKKLKNPVPFTGEKLDAAAKLYDLNCVACHGELVKMMAKIKDGELFWKITKGRSPMVGRNR